MKSLPAVLAALVLCAGGPAYAQARDQIRIVGSSTVFPFATTAAERFGRKTDFKTPVTESTGSGGGLKLFCNGVGLSHPDIANASRRIKASEVSNCAKNGVAEIIEVKIGYDGIVVANSKAAPEVQLTREQIFRALAKQLPDASGALVDNPNTHWNQIDPALPNAKIEVLGPPPTSGTRDAFVELGMEIGAAAIPELAALEKKDKAAFKAVAHAVREDGHYIEAGENDNLIVQKLEANPDALGIFGFSFLDENADRIRGNPVEGIEPTFENIAEGGYGISRSLFVYVKKAHVGVVPGIQEFIAELTSDAAASEDGYLADRGLIPLPDAERAAVRENAASLTPLEL